MERVTPEKLIAHIAEFERQNVRVPTIRELARVMGLGSSALRNIIDKLLAEEKSEGTPVSAASLREILLGAEGKHHRPRFGGIQQLGDREIFLINEDGTHVGVVLTKDALLMAREKNLDLFVLNPDANPPIAKLMNHGRHKFEQKKSFRAVKRKRSVSVLKELRVRYEIDAHDYQIKLGSARDFLESGNKVKLSVLLRGREIEHADLALTLLKRFAGDLSELATLEEEPKLDGKTAILIMSPSREVVR